jgi:ubiquinone/menaquinone biosynthesis C-methylase UbiE
MTGDHTVSKVTDAVRDPYDAMAEQYAALFLGDLDRDRDGRDWLAAFAKLAAPRSGAVADLGCGPGHVVNHLCELGLTAVGYDLSLGLIARARSAFPGSQFHVGDLAALDNHDASVGGIVARYSLIHIPPSRLKDVFEEWMRVLEPGAPVLVSFFASRSAQAHGSPFDHTVVTAYELFPATIARELQDAGFADVEVGVRPPPEGGRPFDQGTVLAHKPST